MLIRTATMSDLDAIAQVEALCFPAAEAASRQQFQLRLKYYANHFWLLFDDARLISFVDGFVTNQPDLTDEMYADAAQHDENGSWQMIFGVNTIPECRQLGYAGKLLRQVIRDAQSQQRQGLVLTCKNHLVPYYAKFGFCLEGVSASVHGNAQWNQMRLTF